MFRFLLENLEGAIIAAVFGFGILRWIATKLGEIGAKAVQARQHLERGIPEGELGGSPVATEGDSEWEVIEEYDRGSDEPPPYEDEPDSHLADVSPPDRHPNQMTVPELRDYFRAIEQGTESTAPVSRTTPLPPVPAAPSPTEEPVLHQVGTRLLRTESTQAYDVSDDDAYAIVVTRKRKHDLVRNVSVATLRRAILWREILDPPLSLREKPPGVDG